MSPQRKPFLSSYGSFGPTTEPPVLDDDECGSHLEVSSSAETPLWDNKSSSKLRRCLWNLRRKTRSDLNVGLMIAVLLWLLLGLVGVVVWLHRRPLWFRIRYGGHPQYHHVPHGSTVPTLLSVRHHTDGTLVNALKNHVYEDLKRATFHKDDFENNNDIQRQLEPTIRLTAELREEDNSLMLKWSSSIVSVEDGDSVFQPTDILALYCSNDLDDGLDVINKIESTHQFLEMATLEQVQATHLETMRRMNTNSNDSNNNSADYEGDQAENCWLLESFPVRRFSVCQFLLYRPEYKEDNDSIDQSHKSAELHHMASSTLIRLNSRITTPAGIHLSATFLPNEMVVSFSTGSGSSGIPIVAYGTASNTLGTRATGTSTTYTASDLCMEPANLTEPGKFVEPGALHTVLMTNLQPKSTYYYQVGLQHEQGVTWSDTFSFHSPLAVGDTSPFTYLVYGDQGCPETGWTTGAAWTAALTEKELPHIRQVHHFGDLSYAKGAAHIWDAWLDMIQPVASRVPYHVAVGNHEYDYMTGGTSKDPSGVENDNGFHPFWGNFGNDSGGECGVPTAKRFTMPNNNENPSNGVFWYSHDFGMVHTIVLSSEHNMAPGSRQHDWFLTDLLSVNRSLTPWIVLELHRSMYESETFWDQNAVGIGERHEIEKVLVDYKVDLVLSGHYHAYLRSCDGLFHNHCNHGGPTHITVGTAGAALDDASTYDTEWTARYIQKVFGYGRITVANATALLFEFVRAGDANDETTGDVLDHVWLKRQR